MNSEAPIACDLSAIGANELGSHRENGEALLASIQEAREPADGYALRFPPDTKIIQQTGPFQSVTYNLGLFLQRLPLEAR